MSTPKVLLVDDQPAMRAVVVAALEPLGYAVSECASGEQALAVAAEWEPDMILLDVMMPGMTGIEACRRLRENPVTREIPVVLLTALDDRQSRLDAIAAGADDILRKPTDLVELRLRVQTICKLSRYRRLAAERGAIAALVSDGAPARDDLDRRLRHRERLASLGTLSASIAHELASVLTIIDMATQQPDGTDRIRRATARGARLVRQLLRSARPPASPPIGVTVQALRDDLVPGVSTLLLDACAVSVHGDDAVSLPLTRPDLEQVLINLVANARDAGATAVSIEVERHRDSVELAIRDNGRGLPSELRERLGAAFVTTRDEQGHGLGVWTVRRILEEQGGALRYEANPDGGTIARCNLPLREPALMTA